jgi:ribonuclease HII
MSSYLIGFDEAGYGPTLGPLVVTAVVFKVPNSRINLWDELKNEVSSRPAEKCKITVCDSKKIYTPANGINKLEKSLLPFVLLNDSIFINTLTIRKLIETTTNSPLENVSALPWYELNDKLSLPLVTDKNLITNAAHSLKNAFLQKHILFKGAYSCIIDADNFNKAVSTKNKSDLLFDITKNLLIKLFNLYWNEAKNISIYAGKHGGKTYYHTALSKALPEYSITTLKQSHTCSEYAISNDKAKKCLISFVKNGEDKHFPIALASMYCKYQRELCMKMFNNYWNKYLPSLKPTAGYYTDSRRFLSDITPIIKKLAITPQSFVRTR